MSERTTIRTGEEIGRAIADLRRARGLSTADLAEMTGLSRAYVEKIEAGRTTSLIDHELRVLRRLGAELQIEEVPRE